MQPSDEAERFEQALAADPDDRAGWAAYADYLAERSDPRAELMHVQLALEDEGRSAADRRALQDREQEIFARYQREWLGELAPHVLDGDGRKTPWAAGRWRWGLLSGVTTQCLTYAFAQCLVRAPAARFLRELRVHGTASYRRYESRPPHPHVPLPAGIRRHWELFELIGAPWLDNLRVFQMGGGEDEPPEEGWCDCHTIAPGVEHVIAGMDRVEELHLLCKGYDADRLFALPNLTCLRVLRVYHLSMRGSTMRPRPGYVYPLDMLAANRSLGRLTHLLFHPHYQEYERDSPDDEHPSFLPLSQVRAVLDSEHLKSLTHLQLRLSTMGDEGCREIVRSGILKRLKVLDLRHGCVTDAGARLLAECPDVARLERLDLSRNAVRAAGLEALLRAGARAVANGPLTDRELEDGRYLFEGDFE
jgi:uncharacterized protein (TIGR02996 family)